MRKKKETEKGNRKRKSKKEIQKTVKKIKKNRTIRLQKKKGGLVPFYNRQKTDPFFESRLCMLDRLRGKNSCLVVKTALISNRLFGDEDIERTLIICRTLDYVFQKTMEREKVSLLKRASWYISMNRFYQKAKFYVICYYFDVFIDILIQAYSVPVGEGPNETPETRYEANIKEMLEIKEQFIIEKHRAFTSKSAFSILHPDRVNETPEKIKEFMKKIVQLKQILMKRFPKYSQVYSMIEKDDDQKKKTISIVNYELNKKYTEQNPESIQTANDAEINLAPYENISHVDEDSVIVNSDVTTREEIPEAENVTILPENNTDVLPDVEATYKGKRLNELPDHYGNKIGPLGGGYTERMKMEEAMRIIYYDTLQKWFTILTTQQPLGKEIVLENRIRISIFLENIKFPFPIGKKSIIRAIDFFIKDCQEVKGREGITVDDILFPHEHCYYSSFFENQGNILDVDKVHKTRPEEVGFKYLVLKPSNLVGQTLFAGLSNMFLPIAITYFATDYLYNLSKMGNSSKINDKKGTVINNPEYDSDFGDIYTPDSGYLPTSENPSQQASTIRGSTVGVLPRESTIRDSVMGLARPTENPLQRQTTMRNPSIYR
jgi:hypothetical protein